MIEAQSKVETLTESSTSKMKKIRTCMYGYPEGITPKLIALKTGINVNTVKSILPKMNGIKKVMRGYYKVDSEGDTPLVHDLFEWNFHNCILSFQLRHCSSYNLVEEVFDFGIVKCVLVISNSKRATFRVSTDWPLNVSSLSMVAGLFVEKLSFFSDDVIDFKNIMVSTIEFNKDYKNLRLDGVNSISVDNLVEQFKLYQKKRGLRVEHKTKVPLSVESVVDMLSNNPNSVEFNVKLNEQKVELERLTKAFYGTSSLLVRLIDKIGEMQK